MAAVLRGLELGSLAAAGGGSGASRLCHSRRAANLSCMLCPALACSLFVWISVWRVFIMASGEKKKRYFELVCLGGAGGRVQMYIYPML